MSSANSPADDRPPGATSPARPRGVALTALYVPGDRPERFAKAAASGADIVIVDLEDAVAPSAKDAARDAASRWLADRSHDPDRAPAVQVRVNAGATPWCDADLAMLAAAPDGAVAVRLPKVEAAADIDRVVTALGPTAVVHALIETALGVESAYEIARHPAVATLGIGEADLASDLRTSSDRALDWARSRVVVAARAARLPAPMMAVYAQLGDDAGLSESCRSGRSLGFFGRAAIHPRQLPVIVEAFRPGAPEVAHAREVVAALSVAAGHAAGVTLLPTGQMLDAAMLGLAQEVLARERAATAALHRLKS